MSTLTSELNLAQAVDADDTADYLTKPAGLAGSLATIDGLFSSTTGHAHNGAHQGATLGPNAFADGTLPGAKLVDGSVTTPKLADGAVTGPKLAANLLEALYAGSRVATGTNYTVVQASNVMWVFCTAAVLITLTSGIERPITIVAVTGNSNAQGSSGGIFGGSADPTTGAVTNGRINQGEAFTYRWDGANWRAC